MQPSKKDLLIFLFLLLFIPLFFYNLGGTSLVDFDEAWFAEVARNILVAHQPFLLKFNGALFDAHPPLGFIFMAISMAIFGVKEFAARFPSALLGFGCLILVYGIGKQLFNRAVGVGAALVLVSSVWFVFRARSANLDTPFVFFYLLSFYAALKAKERQYWLYILAGAVAAVFMVKAMIGLSILVPIGIYLFQSRRHFLKQTRVFVYSIFLFILILLPWIGINWIAYGWSYFSAIVRTGARIGAWGVPPVVQWREAPVFVYLHYGMGKWFYPFLLAFLASLLLVLRKRQFLPLIGLIVFLIAAFLANAKTEIWHLLPLYPFVGLIVAGSIYSGSQVIFLHFKIAAAAKIASFLTLILILPLAALQMYNYRNNIRLFDRGASNLAFVSSFAKNSSEPLFLDGHDFWPSSVFYAQKHVGYVRALPPPQNSLRGIIDIYETRPFLLLTEDWRLKTDQIDQRLYEVVAQKGEWLLIKVQ